MGDSEASSRGEPATRMDDTGRVDQIMRIDTAALLNVIRELEVKLSEHHRQDKIPPWAEALIQRIDNIEKSSSSSPRKSQEGSVSQQLSLNEFASDERLIVKMRSALDSQLSTTRLSLESRMNSVSFELDRLHKLLHIRPTTSEFQQVVLSVNEVQRKMFDSLHDISTGIKGTVQEKVSTEMDYFMRQLKTNEDSQKKSAAIAMKKIDALSSDILNLKMPNNTDVIEQVVQRMSAEIAVVGEELSKFKPQQDALISGLQYSLTEVRFAQNVTRDMLADYKVVVAADNVRMEETVRAGEENVTRIVREVDERALRTLNSVNEAKDACSELQGKLSLEADTNKITNKITNDTLYNISKRLQTVEDFVRPQIETDMVTLVKRQEAIMDQQAKSMKTIEEKMEAVTVRSTKQMKALSAVQEDLNGRIPEKIGQVNDRLNSLSEDTRVNEENVKMIENLLRQTQDKLGEIYSLKGDVEVNQESLSGLEHVMRSVQGDVTVAIESTHNHEYRIESIMDTLSKSEEGVGRLIEDMRESLFDMIMEKQGEIDADVKNLRENLEIMSQVTGMGDGVNNVIGTTGHLMGLNNPTQGGLLGTHSGGAIGSVGSHSGEGLRLMGPGGPGFQGSNSPGGVGFHPHNGPMGSVGMMGGTMGMGMGGMSPGPNNGGATAGIAGLSHIMANLRADSADPGPHSGTEYRQSPEERSLLQQYALVIADICLRFEDLAVRKSNVPNLPSAMCGHVTTTSQAVSSLISNAVDAEIVHKAIRTQVHDPSDQEDDSRGTDKRETKIEEFIFTVVALVVEGHPQTGNVRMGARDKFTKLLRKALMMCMSRHDQVLVLGSSRFGRVKIPSCIACDRPLLDKVRMDSSSSADFPPYPNSRGRTGGGAPEWGGRDTHGFSPSVSRSPSRPHTGGYAGLELSASLPLLQSRSDNQGSLTDGRGNYSQGAYVLRGGFKMPRPGKGAFALENSDIGSMF